MVYVDHATNPHPNPATKAKGKLNSTIKRIMSSTAKMIRTIEPEENEVPARKEHPSPSRAGWIEVIAGSMFSGKSEELIRRSASRQDRAAESPGVQT